MRCGWRSSGADGGSVTAEMAVALPTLVVALLFAVFAEAAVSAQLRCVDAARTAARALARGDTWAAASAAAREMAPPGARLAEGSSGELVRVEVVASVRAPGALGGLLPAVGVSSIAVAQVEPGLP